MQNIHPLFIHFPIALLSVSLLFEVVGTIRKNQALQNAGWWTFVVGVVALAAAITTGLIAESTVAHTDEAHDLILQHRNLGIASGIFFVVLLIWRVAQKGELPVSVVFRSIYPVIFVLAVALLLTGAHLGGKLVYEFGVGTSISAASHHDHDDDEAGSDVQQSVEKNAVADSLKKKDVHDSHEHHH